MADFSEPSSTWTKNFYNKNKNDESSGIPRLRQHGNMLLSKFLEDKFDLTTKDGLKKAGEFYLPESYPYYKFYDEEKQIQVLNFPPKLLSNCFHFLGFRGKCIEYSKKRNVTK